MKRFLLSMALLLAFCVPWAHATEPVTMTTVVADGTAGSNNYYVPVYAYYCDAANVAQVIYPASYLSDLTAGDEITKLKFFVTGTDNTGKWDNSTFNVKLANTTQGNLSSSFDQTPTTTVYTGTLSATSANGMTVTFTNPFVYTGGNLLVQFEQPTGSDWSSTYFPGVSLSGAGRYKSGGTDISSGGTSTNTLPKCEITFTTIPPACMALQSLTATATRTSVTATWAKKAAMTNCAGFKVKLSSSSNPEDEAIVTQTISDPATLTYTFEHLERETQYYVHARVNCGDDDGESDWTTTVVTTGGLIGCEPGTTADGTQPNASIPLYGYYADAVQKTQSIYPAPMLTGLVGQTISKLKYYVASGGSSGWQSATFYVRMMTTTATTLSGIVSTTDATTVYTGTLAVVSNEMEINLTTPFTYTGGNLLVEFELPQIATWTSCSFYGVSATSASYYQYMVYYGLTGSSQNFLPKVDFTYCYTLEACPAVDTVIISDSTQTTANVSWTASTADYFNTYDLVVSTTPVTDFSTVTPRHTGLTGTTDTLMDLLPYTDYYVYVRVNCDGYGHDDGEAWSEAAYFKTLSNCITPSNLAMELRGKTTGMVTWTGTTQASNYRYILSTEPVADPDNAPVTVDSIAADSVLLTGLTPGTDYYFYLSNACSGTDGNSPYMLLEFTTPDACIAPEDINITDIQKYQMTLNWTASQYNDSTDSYDIIVSTEQVTEFEGVVPTYTGVKGNSKVLDTLQRYTLYYVYIRTNCGEAADPTNWEEVTATTKDLISTCDSAFTIGAGSSTTYGPVNGLYGYERNIYLYTSADGLIAAELSTISWQYTAAKSIPAKIYLKNTTLTDLSSLYADSWNNNIADATLVYDGTVSTQSSGWTTIDITNFNYTGNNLIVLVASNYGGSGGATANAKQTTGPLSSHCYVRNDYNIDDNNVMSTFDTKNIDNARHNIKFGYCFNEEACPTLKNAPTYSDVTNVNATLTWNTGKGDWATSYDILASTTEVTEFEGKEPTVSGITDTTYTFAGETALTPNTHYYMYVRVNCVNEHYNDSCSDWSPACEFTTELPCLKPTNFVKEDSTSNSVNLSWVEKNGAEDWNIIKNTNGEYDTIAVNKSQCTFSGDTIRYTYTGLQPETYYTFLLQANCGEVDSLSQLAADAPSITTLSNKTDIDTIKISSAEVIGYVKDADAKTINITLRKGSDRANVAYEIDYSDYAYGLQGDSVTLISPCDFTNPVTVKVYAQDTLVSTLWTITMVEEACATPYDFEVTDIQRRSAVLNWNVGDASTSFDLVVSDIPIDYPESGTIQNITATNVDGVCTYTLTGLHRENTYHVFVRTNCGETFGQWRGGSFTTPALSFCDSIEVGDANVQNADIPASFYYKYGTSAQIYTADEIGAAAEISSLAYEFTANRPMNRNVKIYLVETDKTVFTSTTDWPVVTTNDLVFDGTINWARGWNKITLSKTFSYSGEHNLMVLYDDNTGSYGSSYQYFRCYSTTSGSTIYNNADPYNLDPTATISTAGTLLDIKNQIRFGYCVTNDACPAVDTVRVDEPGVTETTIHWAPSTGDYANRYQIIKSETEITDFTGLTPTYDNIYDTIYTLTGLTGYTTYYVYVRAVCDGEEHDDGVSGWKGTTFLTESACPYPRNVAAVMTGKNTARLSWTNAMGAVFDDENFEYAYSTTEAEPASGTLSTTGYGDMTGLANSTTYYCYVRRVCGEPDGNSPWIKTSITTVPAMPAVINLAASNISYNAFTATWESNTAEFADETEWEVSVVTTGETPTNWVSTNTREHFALGLDAETSYDIYVRAKSGSEYSANEMITVTTTALPAPCITRFDGGSTNNYSPMYVNYFDDFTKTNTILPADSLTDLVGKDITSMSFYIASAGSNPNVNTANVQFYLKEVANSTVSGPIDVTEATFVYEGTFNFTQTGAIEIPFNSPFRYNGGNLLIAVQNTNDPGFTNVLFAGTNGIGSYGNGTNGSSLASVTSFNATGAFAPKTTFCTVPDACAKPNNIVVDNITTTTARAHWYPGSNETAWKCYVSTEELTDEQLNVLMHNGQTTDAYTTPVVDLTGLTKDMDYYLYVGIECVVSAEQVDTLWTAGKFFQTLPTCSAPINAQADNTGDNEITFDATAGQYGTVGTYDFRYWPVGTTDTTTVAGQVSQIVVNNLLGDTDYDWEVRANCSGTDEGASRWTRGNTVHVCGVVYIDQTHSYDWGFEGTPFISNCWSTERVVISGSYYADFNWIQCTSAYYQKTGSTACAQLQRMDVGNITNLVTPMFNIPDDNRQYEVSFWIRRDVTSYDNSNPEGVKVFVNTTPDTVGAQCLNFFDRKRTVAPVVTTNGWYQYYTTIPTTGNVYVIFQGISAGSNSTYIDDVRVAARPTYNVTSAAAPAALGNVAMTCGATDTVSATVFYERTEPVFTAAPATGMMFTNWTNANNGDTLNTVNPWTIKVMQDTNIVANFDTASYNLTVEVADGYESLGTVEGSGTFKYMRNQQFSATAVPHYHVVWADGSYDAERTITMPAYDTTFKATFAIDTFTVTTTQNVDSMGTITGAGRYTYGEFATITATPADHHHFVEWSNGEITPQISVEVVKDSTLNATFRLDTVYVTALSNDYNLGQVSGFGYHGYNRPVTLIAHREPHYHVKNWSNGMTGDTIVVYPTGDTTITCYFVIDSFQVYTAQNVDSMGTVSGAATYAYGADVTVTATPAAHHHFVDWAVTGETATTLSFTMPDYDTTFTANFAIDQHTITPLSVDTNKGYVSAPVTANYGDTVIIAAQGIDPFQFARWENGTNVFFDDTLAVKVLGDETYTAYFKYNEYNVSVLSNDNSKGAVVGSGLYVWNTIDTLVALPAPNHHFIRWSNGSTDNPYYLTVTKDTVFTGYFGIDTFEVKALSNVAAMGTVTGGGLYEYNDLVTVTATPAANHHFLGWSNGATANTLTWNVTEDSLVIANFAIDRHTIAVGVNDVTLGTLTGATNGEYNYGTQFTLTATPATEHIHFVNWSDNTDVNPYALTLTQDTVITANFAYDQHTIALYTNNEDYGTVSGAGIYDWGTTVTITATPEANYHFVQWNDGVTTATRNILVGQDTMFVATFAIDRHVITVNVNDPNMGSTTGAGEYDYGTAVNLIATPANNHVSFDGWYLAGVLASNLDTFPIIVDNAYVYEARFAYDSHVIVIDVNGNGTVQGAGTHVHGTTVTLTATAAAHNHFVNWSNGSVNPSINVTVLADDTLTANFAIDQHIVTANVNDAALGSVNGGGTFNYGATATLTAVPADAHSVFAGWSDGTNANPYLLNVEGDTTVTAIFTVDSHVIAANVNGNGTVTGAGNYTHGTMVTLTANAGAHYHFVNWSNGATTNVISFVADNNYTLTANFAIDQHVVTAGVNDVTLGQVNGAGAYNYGASATLTAVPASHSVFAGWSNGIISNPYTFTVNGDTTVTAIFTVDDHTIAANVNGNGTVSGAGNYTHGAMVTLTATPAANYHFVNWSNGATTNVISFVADDDYTYTANFAIDEHVVTLNTNNSTLGTVQGAGTYNYGTQVTVQAIPANAHVVFQGWSNGYTANPYSINLTSDTNLTAIFALDSHTLATMVNSAALGSVTGAGTYTHGDVATVTAVPAPHCHFVNWNTGSTYQSINLVMNNDTMFMAFFAVDEHSVTATPNDPTMGAITGTGTYAYGTTVTLTAVPAPHYHFVGWSNGATTPTINVNVGGEINLVATFAIDMHTITVNANDPTIGKTYGAGTFAYGTQASVMAVPEGCYSFISWSDGETVNPRTFTLEQDTVFTAIFDSVTYDIAVTVSNPLAGSAYITYRGKQSQATTVTCGYLVDITAVANKYYRFVEWSDGVTDATRTLNLTSDTNLVAVIEPACGEYSIVWNAELLYNGLIMLDIEDAQKVGYHPQPNEVSWYQVVNDPDPIEGVAFPTDDQFICHGFYLSLSQNNLGTGDYYAVVNVKNDTAVLCHDKMRSNVVSYVVDLNAPKVDLVPTNVKTGDIMTVTGLNPDEKTTIRIYDYAGKVIDVIETNGLENYDIQATGVAGVYMVKVTSETVNETLRFIVTK